MAKPSWLDLDTQEDESPGWLDVMADLKVTIGQMGQALKQQGSVLERVEARFDALPPVTQVFGQGLFNAASPSPVIDTPSHTLLLLLGGPEIGRRWIIKNWRVCAGDSAQTAVTGKADLYIGQAVPPPGTFTGWVPVPTVNWRDTFATLPNATRGITSDSFVVNSTDTVFVVITGGTAGQGILAQADIVDEEVYTRIVTEVT